jgi:hypothetical protein
MVKSKRQIKRDRKKAHKPWRVIRGCGCVQFPTGGKSNEVYNPNSCGLCKNYDYHPHLSREEAIRTYAIGQFELGMPMPVALSRDGECYECVFSLKEN